MTSKEFIIWLKGFITACNDYAPTPKQWDIIKEELDKVSDEQKIGTPIGQGGWGTPNVTTIPNHVVTTTPGTTGFITIANPYIASFGSGSVSGTAYGYMSGSTWHYTNNTTQPFSTQDDDSLKPTHKKRKKKTVEDWEEEIDLGGHE